MPSDSASLPESPLLQPWPGPHGGVPPWDQVRTEEFLDAFDAAIELAESEIQRIVATDSPPTFDNTLVPLEQAGQTLERLSALFFVHASTLSLGSIPEIEREVEPKVAAYADRVRQNSQLFARIAAVHDGPERQQLSGPQQRLLDDRYREFVRKGAKLDAASKTRLSEINQRLARLYTDFSQNVLADEQSRVTWIERSEDLAGLPDSLVEALASAARQRGQEGKWAVANTRSSVAPVLTYADSRALREQVWKTFTCRGDNGDAHDNNALIVEIVQLRRERARLLGYPTHAHWRLETEMAKTPEAAMQLMMQVWPKAVARVREEVGDMQKIADAESPGITIEPWDYRYYAEKVRKAKYDLDFNEVKPYLQLEKLRQAMMWVGDQLFGLKFVPRDDLPVYHPDVRVWEVQDQQRQHVGLFYFDPFAREGKRSGAWMSSYRDQQHIDRPISPIVSNNCNFVQGPPGEPTLISWDDAETLFHEFGHALHGLCSQVQYPSQSGTNVARDYVEFPSQLCEHWLWTPQVLERFALHSKTGQPLPRRLLEKIEQAATFNQGFATVEFLASGLVDLRLHLLEEGELDPREFERATLEELGMPREIVMRHRLPHFQHIFTGDGYSAGYYSYLWADAITADAAEAFAEAEEGFYDVKLAHGLYEYVLSKGDTLDPAQGYRAFRGRDVDTTALMRERGFPVG